MKAQANFSPTTNRRKAIAADSSVLLESNYNAGELASCNMGVRLVPRRYSNEWKPPALGSSGRENSNTEENNGKMDDATKRILHRDMTIFVLTMAVTISLLVLSKMQQSPYQYASAAFRALTQGTPIAVSSDDILSSISSNPALREMTVASKSMSTCQTMSAQDTAKLQSMIISQEHSANFHLQLSEARGAIPLEAHHVGILSYLTNNVLRPNWSILDLGCGAGTVLSEVQKHFERTNPTFGAAEFDPLLQGQVLVGMEVVGGWVNEMADELKGRGIDMYQGDITDFVLPEPYEQASFDMIMMTNAIEHMIPSRYGCLFDKLRKVSHPGSLVYIHASTPQAQLAGEENNGETILPHHVLVGGMAMAGFELVEMISDRHSSCGGTVFNLNRLPKSFNESACNQGGHAKYNHMIFQRVHDEKVFELKK